MGVETHRIRPCEALQVKELREEIFKFLDEGTLACCARICSTWSNSALSLLWVELESLKPLLRLLWSLTEYQVCSLTMPYRSYLKLLHKGRWLNPFQDDSTYQAPRLGTLLHLLLLDKDVDDR